MTYFIVEAPYEKCFDLFFKDELGYPNFYRLNELLPHDEQYQQLTLVAPYPKKEPALLEKIAETVKTKGMKYHTFGDTLETAFSFEPQGRAQVQPHFQAALHQAVSEFFHLYASTPSQPDAA